MIKRILIALAFTASFISMSGTVHAQDAHPCQIFSDTRGVLCGLGSRTASANNWLSVGGVNFAFSATNSVAVGSNAWAIGDNSVALGAGSVANQANTISVGVRAAKGASST